MWSGPASRQQASVKCTTAQLQISFDCQFVPCAARSSEMHHNMKADLVHCASTAAVACVLSMSIMYNLSYNTSRDGARSRLHFNWNARFSLSFCIFASLDCDQRTLMTLRYVFVVSRAETLISVAASVRESLLNSRPLFSLSPSLRL